MKLSIDQIKRMTKIKRERYVGSSVGAASKFSVLESLEFVGFAAVIYLNRDVTQKLNFSFHGGLDLILVSSILKLIFLQCGNQCTCSGHP